MTAYEMKLSFMEIEPIFNDDYETDGEGNWDESLLPNLVSQPGSSKKVPAIIGY